MDVMWEPGEFRIRGWSRRGDVLVEITSYRSLSSDEVFWRVYLPQRYSDLKRYYRTVEEAKADAQATLAFIESQQTDATPGASETGDA